MQIIRRHHEDLVTHHGIDLRLVACTSRRRESADNLGIGDIFVDDVEQIFNDDGIDIVIELVGGTTAAKDYVLRALNSGKHVVTANKALMASCGHEVFDAAEANGVSVLFGASVGGGIPIIGPMKHSLTPNSISSIMGIVNGTTNYMLTRIGEDNLDYSEALREAQRKGFAEANPSADVEGFDAAAKIAIIAYNTRITIDEVHTEGITTIHPMDLEYAKEMGYAVKLLAIANRTDDGIDIRVHPAMISLSHQLATVNGVFNAIYLVGDFVGEAMFFGEGAGAGPAASAVMGDVIETAKLIADGVTTFRGCTCTDTVEMMPIENLRTQYYIRIPVLDEPGVFATIAECFAKHKISINSVVQRGGDGRTTDLVVITHDALEKDVQGAIASVMQTDVIISDPQLIRLVG